MTKPQAFWIVGSVVGLFALLPVFAGEMTGVGPAARALPARLAVAKAYGFDPTMTDRLAHDAAKPAAAREAFDRLQAFVVRKGTFDLPKTSPAPTAQALKGAAAPPAALPPADVLEEFRPRLRELGRLGRAAQGGSHYEWQKGYDLLFPQYAPLKAATRTADALARLDAHRGAWDAATQDLLDAGDPWLAYGDQPTIIGELVRSADLSLLFRSTGALLARPAYPAAQARRLHAMFAGPQFDQTVGTKEILVQEASAQFAILDDPKFVASLTSGAVTGDSTRDFMYAARLPQVRRAWQSDLLQTLNDAVPRFPADRYDFATQRRVLDDYERATNRPRGVLGRFADIVGGIFSGTIDSFLRREAQRRVLLLATGLRAGESEAALRRRLGPLAIDPYDGQPLRVGRAQEVPYWLGAYLPGILERDLRVVYSVGPDKTDNGGQTAKQGTDPIDITLPISGSPTAR